MCVIILGVDLNALTDEYISEAMKCNKDGASLAVWAGAGKLRIARYFTDPKEMHKLKETMIKGALKLGVEKPPFIFHARIATHGAVGVEFAHPFVMSPDLKTAVMKGKRFYELKQGDIVAHNGMISGFGDKATMSDTVDFITTIAARVDRKDRCKTFGMFSSSKFATMRSDDGEILYYNTGWIERDGMAFSNHSAFPAVRYTPQANTTTARQTSCAYGDMDDDYDYRGPDWVTRRSFNNTERDVVDQVTNYGTWYRRRSGGRYFEPFDDHEKELLKKHGTTSAVTLENTQKLVDAVSNALNGTVKDTVVVPIGKKKDDTPQSESKLKPTDEPTRRRDAWEKKQWKKAQEEDKEYEELMLPIN